MEESREKYFIRTYLIFGTIFGIIFLIQCTYLLLHISEWQQGRMLLFLSFASVGAGVLFLYVIKRGIVRVFQELNDLMDGAFANKGFEVTPQETELSKYAEKLLRFIQIRNEQAEKEMCRKEQVESLISDISHQTKTPIANILIFGQLLEDMELSQQVREYVERITGQTEKLKWMIETMVNMSRFENGLIQCKGKTNPVTDLVIEALNQNYEKAEKKEIEITLSGTKKQKAVFDSRWTAEALCNILDNAIKYTQRGGTITITVIAYEMYTRIDVADTGMGIRKEEINAIFKRFYRSSQAKNEEGVGIGLYLARKIVSLQNGYIKVQSEAGKGSVFSIYLPNQEP